MKSQPTKKAKKLITQGILLRGLRLRCPGCGDGKLFKGYLKPVESCDACDLKLNEWAGADGPSFFVMSLVITIIPTLAILFEINHAPAPWVHVALWVPLTFLLTVGLLPFFKGLFVALEYKNNTDFFEKKTDRKTDRKTGKKK